MKRHIILMILVMLTAQAFGHDFPIAQFKLCEQEHQLTMDIEFDRADFEYSFTKKRTLSYNSPTERTKLIKSYLNEHLEIQLNEQRILLSDIAITEDSHHLLIRLNIDKPNPNITKIQLKNTCLFAETPRQTNVIIAELNDATRGFRMTKDRTVITIDY